MLKRKSANDPYHEVLVGCSKRAGSSPKINARERGSSSAGIRARAYKL